MSYAFEVGDETVWSPALRVGDLFVRILTDVGAVLKQPTGLTAIASDMYEINLESFEKLTRSMYGEYFLTEHEIFKEMIGCTLGPAVNILNYCHRPIIPQSEEERRFITWATSLSMPR
jgi:hypothetical protein